MLMSIIVIVLVAAVAYFHYVEGFFSATLSAIIAIVAATVTLGYHEVVVRSLLAGKAADQAHALVLVGLFAVTYTVLRIIFDKAIPGNLRLPVLAEKIGAAAAGLVAGIFSVGILVIAAQALPFGPSIAGYARYTLVDETEVQLPTRRQAIDTYIYNTLKGDRYEPGDATGLILPVDDIVINMTNKLSAGGSLAGAVPFGQVHPDYLEQLFGQRLGVQTGARHVAYNLDREKQVELKAVYTLDSLPQADAEIPAIKNRFTDGLKPELKSDSSNINVIVRLALSRNASDKDNKVRINPAGTRLVYNGVNYYPVSTIQTEGGPILRANRVDDFIIVPSDGLIDFVYHLPREAFQLPADTRNRTEPLALPEGTFVEAKRMGVVDLSGHEISRVMPEGKSGVERKTDLPAPKVSPGARGTAAAEAPAGPFAFSRVVVTPSLFTELNVGTAESDGEFNLGGSGSGRLRERKFHTLEVDPSLTIARLRQGDFPVRDLWTPPGQRVVQVFGTPPSRTNNPWEWADKLSQFELIDSDNQSYKPRGAAALVKEGTSDRMVARYNAEAQVNDLPSSEGRPTDLYLIFVVPENTTIKEMRFDGKRVRSLDERVN